MRESAASVLYTIILHFFIVMDFAHSVPVIRFCPSHDPCEPQFPALKVSFVNVGLGDATFIECPDGTHQALIDAGDSSQNYPGAEEALDTFLNSKMKGDRTIELALNTHPHPDHIEGFLMLARKKELRFSKFLDSGLSFENSSTKKELLSLLEKEKTDIIDLLSTKKSSFVLCPALSGGSPLRLKVLVPSRSAAEKLGCPKNLNDCSIMSRIEFGEASVILLADGGIGTEQWILSDPDALTFVRGDVVKFAHHGSRFASSSEFLSRLAPRLGILSHGIPHRGRSDELGYPDFETVSRLRRLFSSREQRSILACQRSSSQESCNWQPLKIPQQLRSTADGTITLSLFQDAQNNAHILVE